MGHRCGACDKGLTHGIRRSVGCRKRYQQCVAEQRDLHPSPALREQPVEGSEVVDEQPDDDGEFDLPEIHVELPIDVDIEGPGASNVAVGESGVPTVEDYLPVESLPAVESGDGSGINSPSDDEEIAVDPETMQVDALLSHESFLP